MPLETASTIAELNSSNPIGASDAPAALDDHIRLIKTVLKADALVEADKGVANGVATLNASGKVVQTALLADSATTATTATDATNVTGAATSAFALTADITPTQITANTNDYAPTGLSTANTLRLSTDASRDLTGLTGGSDGRLMIVHNVGSNALVLKNESASSTAANRFVLGGADVTLNGGQSVTLQYDATASRWRSVAGAGGLSIASTAEAQAGSDNTKAISSLRIREAFNATGTAPIFACRAWVSFNGTGTVAIRASGNVSSITDNGVGDYTVNFTTAMQDTGYAVTALTSAEAGGAGYTHLVDSITVSSTRIQCWTVAGGNYIRDSLITAVAIFR